MKAAKSRRHEITPIQGGTAVAAGGLVLLVLDASGHNKWEWVYIPIRYLGVGMVAVGALTIAWALMARRAAKSPD